MDELQILKSYEELKSVVKVAKSLGTNDKAVRKILKKHSVVLYGKIKMFALEQEKEIIDYYSNNLVSLIDVSKKYNCNPVTIYNTLKKHNIKLRPKGNRFNNFSEQEIDNIIQAWRNGESQHSIGIRYNYSQKSICNLLNKHGFEQENRIAKKARSGSWKGGRIVQAAGYIKVRIYLDDKFYNMTDAGGYVMEHRYVMAQHLNRPLEKYETVHHIDGDKSNNKIENLQLRIHNHGKGQAHKCADCGSRNIIYEELA